MNIDMELARLGLMLFNTIMVVWLAFQSRKNVKQDALDTRMASHTDRLTAMERDLRHAPNHDDLKRIHSRLDEVSDDLSKLMGEFKGTAHTLSLIHEHLLNKKG